MEKVIDLSDFEQFFLEEVGLVAIKTPDGEPLLFDGKPVTVEVYSPCTKAYKAAMDEAQKQAAKNLMAVMGQGKEEADPESDVKFLVAVTKQINNFPYPGGAAAVYRQPRLMYFNDSVEAHMKKLGNFFKGGKKA